MLILHDVRREFSAQLTQGMRQRGNDALIPTDLEPGSKEKITLLALRLEEAEAHGEERPLHHPKDAQVPDGMGYLIWVGKNGRIIDRQKTTLDHAGIIVVSAEELSRQQLEHIRDMFVGWRWAKVTQSTSAPHGPRAA